MALRFTSEKSAIVLTDYRALMQQIKTVEPTLRKQLADNMKDIMKPAQREIKAAIPTAAPLSGMVTRVGRLAWNRTMNSTKPVKNALIQVNNKPTMRFQYSSLAKIRVGAAPTVLADMAGRSGKFINARDETREYDYTYHFKNGEILGKRKHKINGQGAKMIEKLGRPASRYVYPAVEHVLPEIRAELRRTLERAYNLVNGSLMRKS